ncbi:MAG: hypothetical protein LWX07_00680 [Bacteroidetes bacterium]|nr:hypothetical protein [Bacteroidota bacterium]
MNVNLSEEEAVYLLGILEREMADTKSEIHHSDSFTYKDDLKKQIRFIQDLINKMGVPRAAAG